jgi:hypothetical protein
MEEQVEWLREDAACCCYMVPVKGHNEWLYDNELLWLRNAL